jgi:hypothetical protein
MKILEAKFYTRIGGVRQAIAIVQRKSDAWETQ